MGVQQEIKAIERVLHSLVLTYLSIIQFSRASRPISTSSCLPEIGNQKQFFSPTPWRRAWWWIAGGQALAYTIFKYGATWECKRSHFVLGTSSHVCACWWAAISWWLQPLIACFLRSLWEYVSIMVIHAYCIVYASHKFLFCCCCLSPTKILWSLEELH